jgi:hypothetical protein
MSVIPYIEYHEKSYDIGDIDPAYPMLKYLCDRFELNIEQRYWLAFLYGCCYCGPTVYYIYNEFPDFENVDVDRLQRWWTANKHRLLFQTDRLRIRSNNQFIPAFESYKSLIDCMPKGIQTQHDFVDCIFPYTLPFHNYQVVYKVFSNVKYFGRYSMFLWLECMRHLTGIQILPDRLDWKNASNCYQGLMLAQFGHQMPAGDCLMADLLLKDYIHRLQQRGANRRTDIWNVETTLCAYYKYMQGKRWIGYYIQRQQKEIDTMVANVPGGVCWDVLYDFRKEYFQPSVLKQFS